jgi:hypothetical protein
VKVVIDISGGRLVIEGDGPDLLNVLQAARDLAPHVNQIQIVTGAEDSNKINGHESREARVGNGVGGAVGTLRQFVRSLSLNNTAERIAAISYYVNKIEGKPSFAPKEMDGWFTMCGFQKPSQMAVALFDTKRKYGYMENVGRGMWRVSNQGENLIIAKHEESKETPT